MADPDEIHEIKRFCLNPTSAYAPFAQDNTNKPLMVDGRLTESFKHPSNDTLQTNFAESSLSTDHGFELLLRAANHLSRLGDDFPGQNSRQSFEQFPQNAIGPRIPMTSSVILTPENSEQSYPLNLSKASSDTGSNYSSSPDTDATDYSLKANPTIVYSRTSSHSIKPSAVNNFDGKDISMTNGTSWKNGATTATFFNNYEQIDKASTSNSPENNTAHSSISISVTNFDRNALTSFNITNGSLSTNGNLWTNINSVTNGRSSINIDSTESLSLNIAQDDSLNASSSTNGNLSKNEDNIKRLMASGRASSNASFDRNLWRNGGSSTNHYSTKIHNNLSGWTAHKSNGNSWTNGGSSININAPNTDDIGGSSCNGKKLSNGNSSPNQGTSQNRNLSISGTSWTNGPNGSPPTSSLNSNGTSARKRAAILDPIVVRNTESSYQAPIISMATSNGNGSSAKNPVVFVDAIATTSKTASINRGINTLSAPLTAPTNLPSSIQDPVLNVLNLYLGMDGATASQGRSLDPQDPTVNGILWRVQEAHRLAQLLPEDPTTEDLFPIVDVLDRPGVKPDMDETCLISFNQNLARDQGNGPRRSIVGHMDRIVNNDSARSCRIQHTATAAQVSNDVFVQMKRQKQLTERWAEELTTVNYLQELMCEMGLKCDNDEDDDDENDWSGPAGGNIKEEVDSDNDGQLFIDDSLNDA